MLPASLASGGWGPIMLEAIPSQNGLDLKIAALKGGDAPGYREEGGAGVLYQTSDGEGAWTTRLQYALPEGEGLALLAPKLPGRWVFLEPLAVGGVMNTSDAGETSWQLEGARHSRFGDVTSTVSQAGEAPELSPGDTLVVHYAATGAGAESPRNWLVALDRLAGGATSSLARGAGQDQGSTIPAVFAMHQNQPNPFASSTAFRFDLPRAEMVRLEVFDLMGRKVVKLRDAWMPAGRHSLDWEGRDASGLPIRPGAYVYRLTAGSFRAERKLVMLP